MSRRVGDAPDMLRRFMFRRVYNVLAETEITREARRVVRALFAHLVLHNELLPPEYMKYSDDPERRVVDYIAGMTDLYALRLAERLGL
jgi:dGTPase